MVNNGAIVLLLGSGHKMGGRIVAFFLGFVLMTLAVGAEDVVPLLVKPFTAQPIPGYVWEFLRNWEIVKIEQVYMTPFCFYIAHYSLIVASSLLWAYMLKPGEGSRNRIGTVLILIFGLAFIVGVLVTPFIGRLGSQESYGLWPMFFYSYPSYSWG